MPNGQEVGEEGMASRASTTGSAGPTVGYGREPVIKPPVWTWEIPVYFFIGGIAGMAMLIACVAYLQRGGLPAIGLDGLVRRGLWVAIVGALVSPALLISDLGRPSRFLNMLRRFNLRSPMSMGVWILVIFSALAGASLVVVEGPLALAGAGGTIPLLSPVVEVLSPALPLLLILGALLGVLLATYTGVLLAVTVVPIWHRNRVRLPLHFGTASLGSAAAVLGLLGSPEPALLRLLWVAIMVEAGLWATALVRGSQESEAGSGRDRLELLASLLLTVAPAALLLLGQRDLGALCFLAGSLSSRFAWIAAGRRGAVLPRP